MGKLKRFFLKKELEELAQQKKEYNQKEEKTRQVKDEFEKRVNEITLLSKDEKIALLYRLVFRDDFDKDVSYEKRYKMLNRISQSISLVAYLKNRYTRVYRSAVFNRNEDSSSHQKGVFAGRVIEDLTLLNEIEEIKEVNLKQYLEKQKQLEEQLEYFGIDKKQTSNYLINKTF